MWPRKYGWLNFAILECSLNIWIVNKNVFAAPELREKCAAKSEVFTSLHKLHQITFVGGNFKRQYLPHYAIFLGKNLQTWSVELIEHFGIYFGYIQRLFKGGLVPLRFTQKWPNATSLITSYLSKLEPRFKDQNIPYGLRNTMRCHSAPYELFWGSKSK